jgi:hypothetical protein
MTNIARQIELCEQHVRNQSDHIRRIEAATKREEDVSNIHTRHLNTMTSSIADHGRALQSLLDSIKDLLAEARSTKTAINEQSKQLGDLQAQIRSFQEQVVHVQEEGEPLAEGDEPSPEEETTQPETPSFLKGRGQPQTPYQRTRVQESPSRPSSPEEEGWLGPSGRSERESTARPSGSRPDQPDTTRGEGRMPPPPPAMNIPKEVRVKKPDPFSGKKGREAENFIMRMEVQARPAKDNEGSRRLPLEPPDQGQGR